MKLSQAEIQAFSSRIHRTLLPFATTLYKEELAKRKEKFFKTVDGKKVKAVLELNSNLISIIALDNLILKNSLNTFITIFNKTIIQEEILIANLSIDSVDALLEEVTETLKKSIQEGLINLE